MRGGATLLGPASPGRDGFPHPETQRRGSLSRGGPSAGPRPGRRPREQLHARCTEGAASCARHAAGRRVGSARGGGGRCAAALRGWTRVGSGAALAPGSPAWQRQRGGSSPEAPLRPAGPCSGRGLAWQRAGERRSSSSRAGGRSRAGRPGLSAGFPTVQPPRTGLPAPVAPRPSRTRRRSREERRRGAFCPDSGALSSLEGTLGVGRGGDGQARPGESGAALLRRRAARGVLMPGLEQRCRDRSLSLPLQVLWRARVGALHLIGDTGQEQKHARQK